MEKKVKTLQFIYYFFLVTMVVLAAVLWKAGAQVQQIDPNSTEGLIMQYLLIGYVLASVPLSLYLFKKKCDKIRLVEDEQTKWQQYFIWSTIRMSAIATGVLFGILLFYSLGGHRPMIWCAAVAAVALVFCKPTKEKAQAELHNPDNNSENA